MAGKKQALEELLQGFITKFGDSNDNRQIISSEIENFLKNRKKITIKDLDDLEEQLLYKLTPVKKQVRRYSLSPILTKPKNFPSPTLKNIKPSMSPTPNRSNSIQDPSCRKHYLRNESKFRRKDSQLFPNAVIPENFCGKADSNYSVVSPGRRTMRYVNDQWGKIAKAESIKFQQEIQLSMRSNKEHKAEYCIELDKQVLEHQKKQQKLKAEKDLEVKSIQNRITEYQSDLSHSKIQKTHQKKQNFAEYKKAIEQSELKKQETKLQTILEKDSISLSIPSTLNENKSKSDQLDKKNKEIEAENLSQALHKKHQKLQEKLQDSQKDLIHLMQVEKDLTENSNRYKEKIREKVGLAHDEQRLLKFFPGVKSLKEHEAEADLKERVNILRVIQEDEEIKLKRIQDKVRTKEQVAGVLSVQVKEQELKKQEFKEYLKAQGDIWKLEDEEDREKTQRKRDLKKVKQKEIREELDRQVREKEERVCNEMRLNLNESKMNKDIYSTAVKVLGED